ncbi:MAG: hypothetical protein ABEJ61_07560 [Haloferacaceae archaeon]
MREDDSDTDPTPRNPLAPYYPSEVPGVPGEGRGWFAVLLAAMLLAGAVYAAVSVLLPV